MLQDAMDPLRYHEFPVPGKIEIMPTKDCKTQQDLSMAYTPGVAKPCLEIAKDPKLAGRYTNRRNLVAVITNGTAVLGLGNIGPLAGKPVMEGKARTSDKMRHTFLCAAKTEDEAQCSIRTFYECGNHSTHSTTSP